MEMINTVAKSATATTELITDFDNFPGYTAYTVNAPDYAVIEDKNLILNIPVLAGAIFPVNADTRRNPLFMGINSESELACTVILPPGYSQLALLPQSREWTLPEGVGSFSFEVQTRERSDQRTEITFMRTIRIASGELPPELYPAILEYNRLTGHPSMRTLVAAKVR
jgi:hypothetical protein